ncbi:MAG: hypothetical protein IKT93_02395 [Clostridia bacterium]|nr:hypothetical protein [Clostridia bacterium]
MKIKISDRTLCKEGNSFSFKEKIEIARQLEKLNVDVIELPKIENAKADTLLVKTIASFVKNAVISVAVGMTKDGIEKAANALSTAKKPRLRIELPVSTVGMEYTCHKKAEKMAEFVGELVSFAKQKVNEVEFCAVDATRAEDDVLENIINVAIQSGADKITICDTAAEMMPDDFGQFIKLVTYGKAIEFSVCCNNKNGLACANAVAAMENGAHGFKTDVIGEEISLHTISQIMKNCAEKIGFTTNIKYTELNRIINQIQWVIGSAKNNNSAVGVKTEETALSFSANDSKDSVITAVLNLGYDLSEEDCVKVYDEFLRVAEKKNVGTKELDAIVASVALQVPATYKLVSYVMNNGNIIPATAQITLEKDGEEKQGIAIGDGPIDSAFVAIEQIIGCHYELDDFQIQSVTEGKQALGSALVKLRRDGKLYSGNGISTDIIGASIRAYLSAVNKIVYEEANA